MKVSAEVPEATAAAAPAIVEAEEAEEAPPKLTDKTIPPKQWQATRTRWHSPEGALDESGPDHSDPDLASADAADEPPPEAPEEPAELPGLATPGKAAAEGLTLVVSSPPESEEGIKLFSAESTNIQVRRLRPRHEDPAFRVTRGQRVAAR